MLKLNDRARVNGAEAVRSMSEKAQEYYNGATIGVWEYETEGGKRYAIGESEYEASQSGGYTFEEIQEAFETWQREEEIDEVD